MKVAYLFVMLALFTQSLGPIPARAAQAGSEEAVPQKAGVMLNRPPIEMTFDMPVKTSAPVAAPTVQAVTLSLSVEPEFVKPGQEFVLAWSIAGVEEF